MGPHPPSHLKAAAILLVGGWVTFWAGAVNPSAWRFFTTASSQELLEIPRRASEPRRLRRVGRQSGMAIGVALPVARRADATMISSAPAEDQRRAGG